MKKNFFGERRLKTRSSGSVGRVANGIRLNDIRPGLLPVVVSREKSFGRQRESRWSKCSFSFESHRKIGRGRHINDRGRSERFSMDRWESILRPRVGRVKFVDILFFFLEIIKLINSTVWSVSSRYTLKRQYSSGIEKYKIWLPIGCNYNFYFMYSNKKILCTNSPSGSIY